MKRFFMCAAFLIMSLSGNAQEDVTRFLGIPVDGSKAEVERQLLSKGFVWSADRRMLAGEFNGEKVYINVQTDNNKVWRIAVIEEALRDEAQIRIRFNNLCRQFEKNERYRSAAENCHISENEDISYNITVKNKQYEAVYYQVPPVLSKEDIAAINLGDYKNQVWFLISEYFGKYQIVLFYENNKNRADGEDL